MNDKKKTTNVLTLQYWFDDASKMKINRICDCKSVYIQ